MIESSESIRRNGYPEQNVLINIENNYNQINYFITNDYIYPRASEDTDTSLFYI